MQDVKDTRPKLTRRQAQAAYVAVCEKFGETPSRTTGGGIAVHRQGSGVWPTGPILVADFEGWYSTNDWAVLWEGGPEDWSILSGYGADNRPDYPAGVFAERINGYALGLYPL